MSLLKSVVGAAAAVVIAAGLSATGANATHSGHAKWAPVIYKKGKPGKCGTYFFWDKKKKMCKDARWK